MGVRQKTRTDPERALHRVQIAIDDLGEAARFMREAQLLQAKGIDPEIDATHRALICAAVIYYARPFGQNEHPSRKKRPANAAEASVSLEPLKQWIPDAARRRLHRQVIRLRNKIVAHAESRYFEVRMYRSPTSNPNVRTGDYSLFSKRTYPKLDLDALQLNADQLREAYGWIVHAIAPDIRLGKRLRAWPSSATAASSRRIKTKP